MGMQVKRKNIKEFCKRNRFYIVLFLAVSVIAAFFPAAGDDLGWATSDGLALFKTGFKDYNGRYLGNLAALLLTRVPYLLPLIKAAVLTAIIYCMQLFVPRRNQRFLYLSAFLVLVPGPLFVQSVVWTAGFSNYTLPLPMMMACVYCLFFKERRQGIKEAAILLLLLIFGTAEQLFMEPFTIFNLIIALFAVVYFAFRRKQANVRAIVFLVACIIGAGIMFSNGAYAHIARGEDTYQSITSHSHTLWSMLTNGIFGLTHTLSKYFLMACFPALILIIVLCFMILKRNKSFSSARKKGFFALLGGMLASGVLFAILYLVTKSVEKASIALFFLLVSLLLICVLTVGSIDSRALKKRALTYLALIALLCAPLCFVSPIGSRCFSAVHVLLILFVGTLLNEIETNPTLHKSGSATKPRRLQALLAALMIFNLLCYSFVCFANMHKISSIREQTQAGITAVEIEHTPLKFFVYAIDAEYKEKKFMRRFCEYYKLPENITITYR